MKFVLLFLLSFNLTSATFSYSGDWRAEWGFYKDLALGAPLAQDVSSSKTYLLQRFRLKPDFLIYDNVRIKSEWYFLAGAPIDTTTLSNFERPYNTGWVTGGDNASAEIGLGRVWFEWVSDWGVLTIGRQPFNFGLGMLYNDGRDTWSYYSETRDRVAYKLIFGNIDFNLGLDFIEKGIINNMEDDAGALMIGIDYHKPSEEMEMSFMWYMTYGKGYNTYTYSVYQEKLYSKVDIGLAWEFAYQNGSVADYNGNGVKEKLQAFGLLADFSWTPKNFEMGFLTGLASGYKQDAGNEYYGFSFSRAYRLGMLIFNEDIGIGGDSVHGSSGIGSDYNNLGAFFFVPRFAYTFIEKLRLGTSFIYARTHRVDVIGRSKNLGLEWDVDLSYAWKDNLNTLFKFGSFHPMGFFENKKSAIGIMFGIDTSF
jgi:hypothetical protein